MPTTDKFININPNRLVSTRDLKDHMLEYLQATDVANFSAIYDEPGVFDGPLTLDITTIDEFDIVGTQKATDGIGHVLQCSAITYCTDVAFENTLGVVYEIGLEYVETPIFGESFDGIQLNSRSSEPEYVGFQELIGVAGAPNSVTLLGSDLEFRVDSVCEAGVSHAGRTCLVYKNVPEGTSEAVAIKLETVAFTAGENKVTVLADKLGQPTASTTPSDYTVVLLGPTVRRNSSLQGASGVVFIGTVTGGGAGSVPTSSDISGQNSTSSVADLIKFEDFASEETRVNGEIVDVGGGNLDLVSYVGTREEHPNSAAGIFGSASAVRASKIYAFGGTDSVFSNSSDTHVYDPSTDQSALSSVVSWSALANIPDTDTYGMRAATIGDIIYVVGGATGASLAAMTPVALTRRYNAETNTWLSSGAPLPSARFGGAMVAIDGKLYYAAGHDGAAQKGEAWVYDPTLDSWSSITSLPAIKNFPGFTSLNNLLYLYGGANQPDAVSNKTFHSYDPTQDAWTVLATPAAGTATGTEPPERYDPLLISDNGLIHVLFGNNVGGTGSAGRGYHRIYDPITDSWIDVTNDGHASTRHSGIYGAVSGIHYYFAGKNFDDNGGSSNDEFTDEAFAFRVNGLKKSTTPGIAKTTGEKFSVLVASPAIATPFPFANPTQSGIPPLTTARSRHACATLGDRIFVTGGANGGGDLDSVEVFYPETGTYMQAADMPGTLKDHVSASDPENNRVFVIGGLATGPSNNQDVWYLDANTNTWTDLGAIGFRRRQCGQGMLIGDKIWAVAGSDDGNVYTNTLDYFDIKTFESQESALAITSMTGRRFSATAAIGSTIYVIGGQDVGLASLDEIWAINVDGTPDGGAVDGAQITVTGSAVDFIAGAAAEFGGNIYFLGDDGTGTTTTNGYLVFDPVLRTVTDFGFSATQAFPFAGCLVPYKGRLYYIGGSGELALTTFTDSVTSAWTLPDELEIELSNVSTEKTKVQDIAFKSAQIYGTEDWNLDINGDFILMTQES